MQTTNQVGAAGAQTTITNTAFIVAVTGRGYGYKEKDEQETEKVNESHGSQDAFSVQKIRIHKSAIDGPAKAVRQTKKKLDSLSLPFAKGTRLLPEGAHDMFMAELEAGRERLDNALQLVCDDWWNIRQRTKKEMNGAWNPDAFPVFETFRESWALDLKISPIDLNLDTVASKYRHLYVGAMAAQIEEARVELARRILDPVTVLAKKMAKPDGRVFEAYLENIRKIRDLVPALNLAEDPAIVQMAAELEQFSAMSVETLRENAFAKADAKKKADAFLKKFGGVGSRKLG